MTLVTCEGERRIDAERVIDARLAGPQSPGEYDLCWRVVRNSAKPRVETVVRRVRTSQPVVLNFRLTNIDIAKRVLDFCYGLSFGIDGEISELGDRVFAVLPHGITLSQSDLDKLVADGEIIR